jgi:hypothetical protein
LENPLFYLFVDENHFLENLQKFKGVLQRQFSMESLKDSAGETRDDWEMEMINCSGSS